ncbi:MAG: hypothetical protein ACOYXA_17410 [Bacteroidota bacterium]
MKKLFYSSIAITVFSLSIILFQISCQEDVFAGKESIQNKFLYTYYDVSTSKKEFWISNIDGSNRQIIPITPPTGFFYGTPQLTQDGKTLIFCTGTSTGTGNPLSIKFYSVSIDGSNLKELPFSHSGTDASIIQTY